MRQLLLPVRRPGQMTWLFERKLCLGLSFGGSSGVLLGFSRGFFAACLRHRSGWLGNGIFLWCADAAELCVVFCSVVFCSGEYEYDCGNKRTMVRDLEKKFRKILKSIYTISLSFDGIGDWQVLSRRPIRAKKF